MDPEIEEKEKGAGADSGKASGGPLALLLPPDQGILLEARRLVADRTTRIEDLAFCASQDPVIVIDLLRVANAMFFSGGRSPITSAKTAAIRLGADVVLDTFNKMSARPAIEDPDVSYWFEIHRLRCKRASIVATILSEALARQLSEECQIAALFLFIGEMVAAMHLKDRYAKLANESSRSALLFRLAQDYRFDVEAMGVSYLRRHGIPENILSVLDRESRPRNAERAIMKPICLAAGEFIDAFDQNRIDKLSPGKTIPPKSALRTLQMNDQQYLKVYERVAEFLFSFKMMEEKKKEAARRGGEPTTVTPMSTEAPPAEASALQSEIQDILSTQQPPDLAAAEHPAAAEGPPKVVPSGKPTQVREVPERFEAKLEDFNLHARKAPKKTVARVIKAESEAAPPPRTIHTKKGSEFLNSMHDVLDQATTSEELLAQVIGKLIKPGPFEKAALVVVSKDRRSAIVVACRGPTFVSGQTIELDDPLNPLALCLSKVQSFGSKESGASPFGSKAFAVAPIDADHDTPVALYADCGEDGALTFEARRIFRNVVDILNEKLPTLPGGIPIELK